MFGTKLNFFLFQSQFLLSSLPELPLGEFNPPLLLQDEYNQDYHPDNLFKNFSS